MTYRSRRTKQEMDSIRAAIYAVAQADQPVTVRQVFYRLVSAGVIDKTEGEYKSTVVRLLTEMRLAGQIPYGWIADNTRWMRKPTTWDSVEDLLKHTAKTYRRNLWAEGNTRVEVWLEKEALAGVLAEETYEWDVPLMVTRGYPSLTYIREAAEAIAYHWIQDGQTTHVYYFGDHDPSGEDIRRHVEINLADHISEILVIDAQRRWRQRMGWESFQDIAIASIVDGGDPMDALVAMVDEIDRRKGLGDAMEAVTVYDDFPEPIREWSREDGDTFAEWVGDSAPGSEWWNELMEDISDVFTFTKVAVTPNQITEWDLVTRPTKKTDSRSKNFEGESVEVDAIPPADLRALTRDCITQHVDDHQLQVLRTVEANEREGLERLAAGFGGES